MYAGAKHHWVQYMNPKSTFSMLCVCFDSHVDLNIEGCFIISMSYIPDKNRNFNNNLTFAKVHGHRGCVITKQWLPSLPLAICVS